ncbi:hypothetical protein [Cryobacterium sp. GrIS_2_6]|nr:hypothetical protein [Cryobacterium psychrotolerans]MEC5149244.1 hypothetical protein [Cryobacterium psychrotolerans]MEC5149322.1 hypothetical protein [Cryobacterium psychrotolerans]
MVEPSAAMRSHAAETFRMFVAYMQAGFLEEQALALVMQHIKLRTDQ